MSSPSPIPPVTVVEVRTKLLADRPELVEEWEADGRLETELQRLALNATWAVERLGTRNWNWFSTLRETGELRDHAIEQAVWLATLEDLDNLNTFDRDPDKEPLDETQLRSGWFSS